MSQQPIALVGICAIPGRASGIERRGICHSDYSDGRIAANRQAARYRALHAPSSSASSTRSKPPQTAGTPPSTASAITDDHTAADHDRVAETLSEEAKVEEARAEGSGVPGLAAGFAPTPAFFVPPEPPALGSSVVRVMGPVKVTGWAEPPDRGNVTRLAVYLAPRHERPATIEAI